MKQETASPIRNRPTLRSAAKPQARTHHHAPLPFRPPQTGYYLLRLRLQYSNKAPRPLARIL
jgi:hypothetical protein